MLRLREGRVRVELNRGANDGAFERGQGEPVGVCILQREVSWSSDAVACSDGYAPRRFTFVVAFAKLRNLFVFQISELAGVHDLKIK